MAGVSPRPMNFGEDGAHGCGVTRRAAMAPYLVDNARRGPCPALTLMKATKAKPAHPPLWLFSLVLLAGSGGRLPKQIG